MKEYEDVNGQENDPDYLVFDTNLNSYGLKKDSDGVYIVDETYNQNKLIADYIWAVLKKVGESYEEDRNKGKLPLFEVMSTKSNLMSVINGRLNCLSDTGRKDNPEYKECVFLKTALAGGWLPSDIELLSELYERVFYMKSGDMKQEGINLINRIMKNPVQTVEERYNILIDLSSWSGKFREQGNDAISESLDKHINNSLKIDIQAAEFASDENFTSYFKSEGYLNPNQQMTHGKPADNYMELVNNATLYHNLSEEEKNNIRGKKDYVMAKLSPEEMERFNITKGHTHNKITKSNRKALKEVFGEEIYDDIDEMHRGSEEDRTVTIHHSLGNKYLQKGEEVMELDFAGSGFKEARREYNGHHGKTFSDGFHSENNNILSQFGPLVKKPGSDEYFSHLRAKKTKFDMPDGTKMVKTRYSIAGPTPDLWWKPGLLNWGEYSIENTREYGRNFATGFLTPLFEKALKENKTPKEMKDIHINITGHSRGAVSASESVKMMDKWVREYEESHPECRGYGDKVKYKMILRDPVPGIFTKWLHRSVDLRKVKNLDTTLFCSMAQEHYDFNFPLHNVRGAQRIIIGTTDHGMELGSTDSSQMLTRGDGKAHLAGFYDSETGEYFRGSGLTEIPDGVYIADDNYNLIRITSYSQLGKVIDAVYAGKSKQGRVETIHKMVRNWFLDNELKMSFVDDKAREEARENNDKVIDKILKKKNSRLERIQAVLTENLRKKAVASPDELIKQNELVIKECREYMKNTRIPASAEDSIMRMNLVSDLLAYSMRENNYYKALIAQEKGEPENELDAKIRKQKLRMEKKEGALEHKIDNEAKRLQKENSILEYINQTSKLCRDTLKAMDKAGKVESQGGSGTYADVRKILVKGTKLGRNTGISEFTDFLKDLEIAARDYKDFHSVMGGPHSKGGELRKAYAKEMKRFGSEVRKSVELKTIYMGDKNKPIGKAIEERKAGILEMQSKCAGPVSEEVKNAVADADKLLKVNSNKKSAEKNVSKTIGKI